MSELKITGSSIQNGILRDGQFVFGNINNISNTSIGIICSSGVGAVAHGYVWRGGEITASGSGSHAEGHADGGIVLHAKLIASGSGAHAEGYSTNAVGIYSHAEGIGINGSQYKCIGGDYYYLYVTEIEQLDQDNPNSSTYTKKYVASWVEIEQNSSIYSKNENNEYEYLASVEECIFYPDPSYGGDWILETNYDIVRIVSEYSYNLVVVTPSRADIYMQLYESSTGAFGYASHSEGQNTIAKGWASHSEGTDTSARGQYSHAEGMYTCAKGKASHSEGRYTIATKDYSLVCGTFNDINKKGLFEVGCGTDDDNRQNALTVDTLNIKGSVNNVLDVYLGCPVGTMLMWLGQIRWPEYHLPVQKDNTCPGIPNGWVLAKGGSVRLRYVKTIYRGSPGFSNLNENKYANKTGLVYIPRYLGTIQDPDIYSSISQYDVFKLVGYRVSETEWRVIGDEMTTFKFPDNATFLGRKCTYSAMSENDHANMTRFINTIILYTHVRVTLYYDDSQSSTIYSYSPYFANGDHSANDDPQNHAGYLENRYLDGGSARTLTWYENTAVYSSDIDILIELPNMEQKVPVGTAHAVEDFGNTEMHYQHEQEYKQDNLAPGVYGGEAKHVLNWREVKGHNHHGSTASGGSANFIDITGNGVTGAAYGSGGETSDAHNTVQPYMAVNFIMKYC